MPFIVLSDSTLQYLLWMDGSGKSYGVETVDRDPLRQAVICPGASLVMPREGPARTPPVLEVLAWHFIRVLGHVQPFPTDHQPLTDLLKKYYYSDTYVRLIPLRESLNPNKQGAYDWLADVRDQYGLSGDDLADQTIMSLQGNDPGLVEQLYYSKDCHFRPSIAQKAIGLLLGRARTEMMRTHPNSVHVLVVCLFMECQRGLCPSGDACYGRAMPGKISTGAWLYCRTPHPQALGPAEISGAGCHGSPYAPDGLPDLHSRRQA